MLRNNYWLLLISLLWLVACQDQTTEGKLDAGISMESPESLAERMAWWEDARFGMFIHWGLYAVPAGEWQGQRVEGIGEWIMHRLGIPIDDYEQFAVSFNPVDYDPHRWVEIAKNAGMKYIVITSKHHDGFALWDSKVTEWDVVDATPYGKDLIRPLAEACADAGIKLCFYHSIMDWHHPDAQAIFAPEYNQGRESTKVNPNFDRYLQEYMKPQLKELLSNYGDIGVLWFDGEWIPDYTSEMAQDVYKYVRSLQSDIIINNRVDKGRQGMQGMTREGAYLGDFGTPEQEIPATGLPGVYWESCMTMNDTWGFKHFDDNWKSSAELIRNLVDIASKGGNFLLNVGPTAEGVFPAASVERLEAMGKWMSVNGESIYGTQASPLGLPDWGRYTFKETASGDYLYMLVFDWPQGGLISMQTNDFSLQSAELLADGRQLEIGNGSGAWQVQLPDEAPDSICSVIRLRVTKI